ncbi:MAG: MFS transporter, partial [Candidatus Eremiobacteraeota bacterium]|nr:MFS transporter [Candidatus Eremiobacteraeota bacterium]
MNARPAPGWALAAAIVGSSMSFIDGSAVNVALPVLQRDLSASAAAAQWVIESYSLFLSALMLIGGSLGDLFGRRRVYGIGIGLFAIASIGCGFAPNVDVLIAARCLQGVGGALATPGSLALISATYDGEARGRAIGTWSAFSAIMSALGPVIGGWLVQTGSWRFVFFINAPLALVVLALLAFRVVESDDPAASHSIDVPGATLATLGLGSLVYGLISLQSDAFDLRGYVAASLGAIALVAFVAVERRSAHPMVRLDLFASRSFSAANLYTFLLYAAIGGSIYFIPFDLINVQGYPPAAAGAALLPFVAILATLSRFSGALVARSGPRAPLVAGGVLAAAAFAIFAFAGVGRPYWATFFPGAVVLGFAGAAFVAPLTTTVMGAVAVSHAGVASGINNAISRAAGLVAIAALGIFLAHGFETTLSHRLARTHLAPVTSLALSSGRA